MSRVQAGEAEHRVGQAPALAHLLEQPRGGGPAEHAFEHAQREAALVVAGDARARRGTRGTARCPCARSARAARTAGLGPATLCGRAAARRRACARALSSASRRSRLGQLARALVVDRAGGGDHDRLRQRSARVEGLQLLARDRADDLGGADHRAPQRVLAEDGLAEHVEDPVLGIVLVHRDLLEHDLALGLRALRSAAARPSRAITSKARSRWRSSTRVYSEVASLSVPALISAPIASKIWSISSEPIALGAAEQHVLEQVRDARLLVGLHRRARADPEAERHRAHGSHALGDHPHAGVKRGYPMLAHLIAGARRVAAAAPRAIASAIRGADGPSRARRRDADRRRRSRPLRRPPPSRGGRAAAAAAGADAGELLDGLAGDLRVLGEAQADATALAVDLDHAHVDLIALVEHVLDGLHALARARRWRCAAGRRCPWPAR